MAQRACLVSFSVVRLQSARSYLLSNFGAFKQGVFQNYVRKSSTFFVVLILLSGASFMPMFAMYGPYQWLEWLPFTIGQACRMGLYAVYFFGGVFLGSIGLESTFVRHPGALSSR